MANRPIARTFGEFAAKRSRQGKSLRELSLQLQCLQIVAIASQALAGLHEPLGDPVVAVEGHELCRRLHFPPRRPIRVAGIAARFVLVGHEHARLSARKKGEAIPRLGFAGRRVIQETIRSSLPDDFQTAEYMREHGMVELVVPRAELRKKISKLIQLLLSKKAEKGSKRA